MSAELHGCRTGRGRWPARFFAVFALSLVALVAQPAKAIPLGALLGGADFGSNNGELTFGNFEADAEIDGLAFGEEFFEQLILDFTQVFALEDGLAILSPVIALGIFHHVEVELNLSFDVWAEDGLEIVGASTSFLGLEFGSGEASATSSFFDGGDLLGTIALEADGFGFESDMLLFGGGFEHVSVADVLAAEACGCGLAKAGKIKHRFKTEPVAVPEPLTFLLVGSGLTGLWVTGGRRR